VTSFLRGAPPPNKNPGSAPVSGRREACHLWRSSGVARNVLVRCTCVGFLLKVRDGRGSVQYPLRNPEEL